MMVRTALFVKSSTSLEQCPKIQLPEHAFIGRSNVGKSSLINMLCNNRKLAKVSATPGKTQLINHYLVNDNWHLVDLPGYGYAKVSKSSRAKWGDFTEKFLLDREQLQYVFVLIDSRLEPQAIDIEFINHLGTFGVPFVIVFTKTDKLSPSQVSANRALFEQVMLETWEELPPIFMTSSEKKLGRDEVLKFIDKSNKEYHAEKKQA
jgi:GTP-binding protein